jgi:hypothetical protein
MVQEKIIDIFISKDNKIKVKSEVTVGIGGYSSLPVGFEASVCIPFLLGFMALITVHSPADVAVVLTLKTNCSL